MPSFSISNISQTSAIVTINPAGDYVWYRLFVRKDGETDAFDTPEYYLNPAYGSGVYDIAEEIAELEPGAKYWVNVYCNTAAKDDATWIQIGAQSFTTATEYITYIVYDANGGEDAPETESFTSTTNKTTITVSEDVPTREGYVFVGWNTDPDGTGVDYDPGETKKNIPALPSSQGGYTVTLYAIWREETTGGLVWINGKWYQPYIYSGGEWHLAEAYVYDGEWKITADS